MVHNNRSSAFGSLFASLLFLVACGGPPDSVGSGPSITDPTGTDDSNPNGGNGNGGAGIDPGNIHNPSGGDAGSGMGDSGATGDTGPVCGNGVVEAPENCDDGNATPGDGCDGNCQKDANWDCPKAGKACTYNPPAAACGNGVVEDGESCDLGTDSQGKSLNDGSAGCDTTCKTMLGWTCPGANVSCTKVLFCGDGIVSNTLGEQCDDGTNDGSKGCNALCKVITGWKCPNNVCVVDVACGNGIMDAGEQCDDHNLRNYDGCSSTCFVEAGFSCPAAGGSCTRVCGNGKLDAGETCDDSNFYSGDGCSSKCLTETDYTCAAVGQSCVYTPPPPPAHCGNGKIETGELCDDGNLQGGDGCSSSCQLEAGWKCTAPNIPCVAKQCGDGILAGTEQCDDHFVDNAHGCSSTCTIMPNAVCPANGGTCVPMVCGDGKVTGTETCDSGLNDGKHGCSATCQTLPGWICPLAGAPCSAVCGDGLVVGDEQCDESGDALCCSTACKLKPGYVCDPSKTPHSQPAAPYCGNKVVNSPGGTGSTVLGSEQCDDGNTMPFDGCSPTCTNEPLCGTYNSYLGANPPLTTYQCFAHCGDGLVLAPEQCDDGNVNNGDGCDSNCKVELIPNTSTPAWTCVQPTPSGSISMPVVWRDFSPRSHPQFSVEPFVNRRMPNIAQATLKAVNLGNVPRPYKYVPQYNTGFQSPTWGANYNGNNYKNMANWTMNGPGWVSGSEGYLAPPWMNNPPAYDKVWYPDQTATLSNGNATLLSTPAGRFAQWYVDDATVNKTFASAVTLKAVGTAFQYSCDDNGCDSAFPAGGFFPLDGKGWVVSNPVGENTRDGGHNYSFTTEMRSWFTYTATGAQKLSFYGDDDLWVFVNGQLVLDIGGIHSKVAGNFTLNTDGTATTCAENVPGDGLDVTNCAPVALGLVKGTVYEIAIFNAEREVVASNFQLTLNGFNSSPSVCTPVCGDGYVAGPEQCDQGNLNVLPTANTYGKCTTECKLGPYCGDKGLTSPPETCDNGLNLDAYTSTLPTATQCAPLCVAPAYCGDHLVQKGNNEECDDGTANNQNTYGHCQTNCKLGARCGDGKITNGEACDDGANNGGPSSSCDAFCKKKCGNGTKDAGEDCDASTGVDASACDSTCHYKCGNGQPDPGEQCDDGDAANIGSYGGCKHDCTFAPFCGDMTLQNPPEVCDNGASNSSSAYGPNSCTDQCLPGGTCGDGIVNGTEKCDVGNNTGLPGSCAKDCSAYVPSTLCGDGKIQPPEKCDDGNGVNGTAASKCDTACRFKCGNALVDAGEQCDNGVNDGTYGTCTSTCTLAGYCGDGVKNGNEQCDKGSANVDPNDSTLAYGTGVCTKACKNAPFCGDGKVQSKHEACEGNLDCSNCMSTVVK
jgi:fibro-slime domain-containing protein